MPGEDREKNARMASIACQHVWHRDFSEGDGDRLTCEGGYFLYNQMCTVLVDNGPVDAVSQNILVFKWRKDAL